MQEQKPESPRACVANARQKFLTLLPLCFLIEQSTAAGVRPLAMSSGATDAGIATTTTTTTTTRPHNRWQGLEKYAIALGDSTSMRFGRDLFPFGDICKFF